MSQFFCNNCAQTTIKMNEMTNSDWYVMIVIYWNSFNVCCTHLIRI